MGSIFSKKVEIEISPPCKTKQFFLHSKENCFNSSHDPLQFDLEMSTNKVK